MSLLPVAVTGGRSPLPLAPLVPLRRWINRIDIASPWVARWVCRLVPNTCPAAYTVRLWGRTVLSLPSLCHLNPLQDELVDLRFRAADFLYEHGSQT